VRKHPIWLLGGVASVAYLAVIFVGEELRPAVCSEDAPCVFANGCGGTKACLGTRFGPCLANGGTLGSNACTSTRGCGGHLNCSATSPTAPTVIGCQPDSLSASCREICNGLDDDGDGVADNGVAPQWCSNGCGSGTQACTGGTWGPCGGCSGQNGGCANACGVAGTTACTADCRLSNPACPSSSETANNCDDTGNGVIDENAFQTACDL
jgi:hypothetical protein